MELVTVVAISGFAAMSLEVLYTRLFSLVFHNSTYTFGAVVAVFLAGLALGAFISARMQQAVRRIDDLVGPIAGVAALLTLLSLTVFARVTRLDYVSYGTSFADYISGVFLLVGIVVGPPGAALGILLPLAWKAAGSDSRPSSVVGHLTAANTICSALGALTTSFVVLPWLGLWYSFAAQAALLMAVAIVLLFGDGKRWLPSSLGAIFVMLAILVFGTPVGAEGWGDQPEERLVRRWQSTYGWVDVVESRRTGSLKVRQNLHYRFGETANAVREARQSHLPLLLHERSKDVLFMGLGTGLTAAGATRHDDVESVVVVELVPEVIEAARWLENYNNRVVDNSKVEVHVDDARHYLLGCDRSFDVIVSDMFVPWESQTGYLYTVEHYEVAKQHLRPRGLFCQWLPLYQLGDDEFELIADSFANVFPITTIWWGNLDPEQPIVALIGGESALEVDAEHLAARLEDLNRRYSSQDGYLASVQTLHSLYVGDWRPSSMDYLNTDEHPRVEFLAPMSHRNEQLLHGSTLRDYFDRVFVRLPDGKVHISYPPDRRSPTIRQRRAQCRLVLFPHEH